MEFKYLSVADELRINQANALRDLTEGLIRGTLERLLRPRIRNRVVGFHDELGQACVRIAHRRGGHYVISSNDVRYSPPNTQTYGYTAVESQYTPSFIYELMRVVLEYSKISGSMFSVELKIVLS